MRSQPPAQLPLFRSALQARLLALLLLGPDAEWSFRDLRERTGASHGALHRELGRLGGAGLVATRTIGRSRLYRAAVDSPLFEPLSELLRRTLGAEEELRRRLAPVEGIEAAAIFGSWARGEVRADSDIDVLVIGDADYGELVAAIREVEAIAGREINLVAYRPAEWRKKLARESGFVSGVLGGELKPLVGTLEQLGVADA